MLKFLKSLKKKDPKFTSKHYLEIGGRNYDKAWDLQKATNVEKIVVDSLWGSASMNFWMAFVLGHNEAPLLLFKCFIQKLGVEKDSLIGAYMLGVAKKLGDPKCKDVPEKYEKIIYKYMQPAIDQIAALMLNTQKKFLKGADAGELSAQMDLYEEKIGLWTGKLMYTAFLSKEVAKKSIIKFHADHPGWKYLGLGDEAEFADPVDDAGAAAAAGVTALHFDDHQG